MEVEFKTEAVALAEKRSVERCRGCDQAISSMASATQHPVCPPFGFETEELSIFQDWQYVAEPRSPSCRNSTLQRGIARSSKAMPRGGGKSALSGTVSGTKNVPESRNEKRSRFEGRILKILRPNPKRSPLEERKTFPDWGTEPGRISPPEVVFFDPPNIGWAPLL